MPHWTQLVFVGVFILVMGGTAVYLYRRLVRDVTENRKLRLAGAAILVGLAGGAIAARTAFRGSGMAQSLAMLLGLWIGLVLYTLLTLAGLDLIRFASRKRPKDVKPSDPPVDAPASAERRVFLARAIAAGSVISGGGLASWGVYRAYEPAQLVEVPVTLPGLPKALDGFSIVQLSDIHIGAILQQRFIDDLVSRANSLKPDLVAITGDLVDGTPADIGQYVSRLTMLNSRLGTYFCSGNHDHYAGWNDWSKYLTGLGVNVLNNRRVVIGDAGGSFDLLGVEDYGSRLMRTHGYDPNAAAEGRDSTRPSVLLSHQPSGFDDAVRLNLGLQLSGHTHGGQTFPGNGVATLIWGARAVGLSREGNSQLFVSRGCGFVGPPMRLGSPSEIIKIVLLAG